MSNTENNFKSYLLSKCTIGYGIINGLINAGIFYLMEKSHPDAMFGSADIIKDLTFTTFLLGFLLALIVMPLTAKDLEKGKFSSQEGVHKFEKYLPNHLFVFSIIIGIVTCALTIILSSIIVFLFNIAPLTVMQMMIFKGTICAICGGIAGYLCIIKVAYRK